MALIDRTLGLLFGSRNVVAETVEVFRENAEQAGQREAALSSAALAQFGAEFAVPRQCGFDRFMDGVNRLPRPAMALGILGLFGAAMDDPLWFSERMLGLSLVPEPLWWLLGAIVSFYFGARHQAKGQNFQRSIAATLAVAPAVAVQIRTLRPQDEDPSDVDHPTHLHTAPGPSGQPATAQRATDNAALADWRAGRG